MKKLKSIVLLLLLLVSVPGMLNAQQADSLSVAAAAPSEEEEVNVSELVFGHIGDAYEWHIATLGGKEWSIPLPVIVHSSTGWHVFSSSHLKEGEYEGLYIASQGTNEGKIVERNAAGEEVRPFDISITKNVLGLFINSAVLLLILMSCVRWYKKTGFLQIIEPRTIIRKAGRNNAHMCGALDKSRSAAQAKREELKLKYTRRECKMVALWLNNLTMNPEKSCETMHPKREMWVRMIRALRLAEDARKPGFESLKELMDIFYCQAYTVWQGEVDCYRLKADAEQTFALLKQRPGMFARSLFANMLWFGPEDTLAAFKEVVHLLPARLVVTLGMYAENYFEPGRKRMVKPLGGNALLIETNEI